jgi:hypothetical protein
MFNICSTSNAPETPGLTAGAYGIKKFAAIQFEQTLVIKDNFLLINSRAVPALTCGPAF